MYNYIFYLYKWRLWFLSKSIPHYCSNGCQICYVHWMLSISKLLLEICIHITEVSFRCPACNDENNYFWKFHLHHALSIASLIGLYLSHSHIRNSSWRPGQMFNLIIIFSHFHHLCTTCWSKAYLSTICLSSMWGRPLQNPSLQKFLFLLMKSYLLGLVMRYCPVKVQRYVTMNMKILNFLQ